MICIIRRRQRSIGRYPAPVGGLAMAAGVKHGGIKTAPPSAPGRQVFSLFINTLKFNRSGTMLILSA